MEGTSEIQAKETVRSEPHSPAELRHGLVQRPATPHQSRLRATAPRLGVNSGVELAHGLMLPVQASLQGEYQRSMAAQEGEAQHAVTQEELQQRAEAVKARLPE